MPYKDPENQRRYAAAHRERIRESQRRWYAANQEKVRESQRLAYAANPEKARERKRRAYAANPKKHVERVIKSRENRRKTSLLIGLMTPPDQLRATDQDRTENANQDPAQEAAA